MLKIGLFSLKDNVGCRSLSIHVANFIAGSSEYATALIEKRATKQEPEFHRFKNKLNQDGTFVINNVHVYPQQKLVDYHTWPFIYEPLNIKPTEDAIVYDFGAINFMFEFPKGLNKLYLVSDADELNISKIRDFCVKLNEYHKKEIPFDLILVGASKNQIAVFKQNLPQITSVIVVPNKKEIRIDYNFSVKLQMMFRSSNCGLNPPEYHQDWEYEPVEFYEIEEWNKMLREKALKEEQKKIEAEKKRNGLFKKKPKKETKDETQGKSETIVMESNLKVAEQEDSYNANVFEEVTFDLVPPPTAPILNTQEKEALEKVPSEVKDTKEKNPEPVLVKSVRPAPEIDAPSREEISELAASFEPENLDIDVSGEYKEHIVYEHKQKETGILGDIIEGINRGGHFCCNLFIATNDSKLFILSSMEAFFEKLDKLKVELKNNENIHYAILTYNDETRKPLIISNDSGVTSAIYDSYLKLIDSQIRTSRDFNEQEIKNHMELSVFDEIIYA